jgi:hypothetical protein
MLFSSRIFSDCSISSAGKDPFREYGGAAQAFSGPSSQMITAPGEETFRCNEAEALALSLRIVWNGELR